MGSMVHLGQSREGPGAEQERWSYQAEDLGADQTGKENPAVGPNLLLKPLGKDPHGEFVTRKGQYRCQEQKPERWWETNLK